MDTTADESDLPHFDETVHATTRYLATLSTLSDAELRAPSALPGWTRAHVVAHLSRNADALTRVLHAAVAGEVGCMYDSAEQRDAEIEEWAGRSAEELREDSAASWGRLVQAENELHLSHLDGSFSRVPGAPTQPIRSVGLMRRTEVEVHHADLLAGYTPRDWPVSFARDLIKRRQDELAAAEGGGVSMVLTAEDVEGLWKFGSGQGPTISGAVGDLAWWLVGRGNGEALRSSTGEIPTIGRWR